MLLLQILVNGVLVGGLYVLVAQSLNLIFGVMGVVNLAHGSFIVLAGLFTYWFTTVTGLNPLLVLPIAFVVLGLYRRRPPAAAGRALDEVRAQGRASEPDGHLRALLRAA